MTELKAEINSMREKRLELERSRDDLLRSLKQLHQKISHKRKDTKDIWKKRYYAEKKKTPELEEKYDLVFKEVEATQAKMLTMMEDDINGAKRACTAEENEARVRENFTRL